MNQLLLYYIWNMIFLTNSYKAAAMPIYLYGSKSWGLKKWDEKRNQTTDRTFLGAIANVRRKDEIRNEDIN